MPDVQEVFDMTTQKVRPHPGALERQHSRQRRAARTQRVGTFTLVLVLVGAVAAFAVMVGTDRGTAPITPPALAGEQAIDVAQRFLSAFAQGDRDGAIALLAPGADLGGLLSTASVQAGASTEEHLRSLISLLEAQRYDHRLGICGQDGETSIGVAVSCGFEYHLLGSDAIGSGGFEATAYLRVDDGAITQASVDWDLSASDLSGFSPEVWQPFADWIAATHPEDATVLYADPYTIAGTSHEAIASWADRVEEFVAMEQAELVDLAERFMAARDDHDANQALSMIEEPARVRLTSDYAPTPWALGPLSDDGLRLAFEAERILDVRFASIDCEPSERARPSAVIRCSYLLDDRLLRAAGMAPVESWTVLGTTGHRVSDLTFPWLNIGFNPDGLHPAAPARFVRWLRDAHPEAGRAGTDGALFRTQGQELVLELTPEALELWERYLDEYEAAIAN